MESLTIQQAFDLALRHHQAGQFPLAESLYKQILSQQPQHAQSLHHLGVIAAQTNRFDVAVNLIRQSLALEPANAEAWNNLGNALKGRGELDEALKAFHRALALKPQFAQAHNNLGNALAANGQLDRAIDAYHQAIALQANYPQAYSNLGQALRDRGHLADATAAHRQAISLNPNIPETYNNLGIALADQGLLDEAIAAFRQALVRKPNDPSAHSNLLNTMQYDPAYDARVIADEFARWNQQFAQPLTQFIQPHLNDRNPDRRLKIGYVSADLRDHPVGRFLLPLLKHHDKEQVEVFAYAASPTADAVTQCLRSHTDHWQRVFGLSDAQAVDLIRHDQIDILIDLAGHSSGNRLLMFARKPAPVQVSWLGYPNTTGLETMDYRLTDALADPPGLSDTLCREKVVRLPQTAWCYAPATEDFPVSEKPVTATTPITFGSFNNLSKISIPMVHLWVKILRSTPNSRLLIKAKALDCPSVNQRVRQAIESAGLTSAQLTLQGWRNSHEDHLASYRKIDIALDTFPYHGTTTTCEALWMGVPVITLAGKTHVSRVGVSLLTNVGVSELIAYSEEQYIQNATDLARDPPRLSNLRSTLRQRMEHSALMDAPRFARNIEAAYRRMWHTWCRSV